MMTRMLLVGLLPIYLLFSEIELCWANTDTGPQDLVQQGLE